MALFPSLSRVAAEIREGQRITLQNMINARVETALEWFNFDFRRIGGSITVTPRPDALETLPVEVTIKGPGGTLVYQDTLGTFPNDEIKGVLALVVGK